MDDQTYSFYHIGHAFLSDRAAHVHALMGEMGYTRCDAELFYWWPNIDLKALPPSPPELSQLTVEFQTVPGRGSRPNGILRIYRGGDGAAGAAGAAAEGGDTSDHQDEDTKLLALCECLSGGERNPSAAASQDAFIVAWLGVPPRPTPETYACVDLSASSLALSLSSSSFLPARAF